METVSRFLEKPKQSFFLLGPRGTGKSTWILSHCKEALLIDLLSPETYRTFLARPERLENLVLGNPEKKIVVIDEVQKIPELLSVVHKLVEEKKGLQFVLTGSSARKLKRQGTDLLAGRALLKTLHPFMAAELGGEFDFQKALRIGLLPVVYMSPDPRETLQAYASLYLREEVQMEGLVRNMGNFSRFLEVMAFSHASVLNVSNISRECETERKLVESYIRILEDLLLGFQLPLFSRKAKRALIKHPKFYYFDTGVYRTFRLAGPLDRPEEIEGVALEGLVAQHLRAWAGYDDGNESPNIYFWRSRSGVEVDFVVYGKKEFVAIEVKNSSKIKPEFLRSLKAFREDYPESKAVLLYRGKEKISQGGVLCIPCEEFLTNLKPNKPILN